MWFKPGFLCRHSKMKTTVNDPVRELKAVLAEYLPWHGARIGFLAQFLLALFKVRSVNLVA